MDLQTGETTNLGTIEAERVTYICDTFALYYTSDQNGGAIRRMVFWRKRSSPWNTKHTAPAHRCWGIGT